MCLHDNLTSTKIWIGREYALK